MRKVLRKKENVGGRRGREGRPERGRGVLLMIPPPAVGPGRSRRRERRGRREEGGREEQWQGKQNGL